VLWNALAFEGRDGEVQQLKVTYFQTKLEVLSWDAYNFEATHDEMQNSRWQTSKNEDAQLRANWFNLNDERESVALKLIARFQLINMKTQNTIQIQLSTKYPKLGLQGPSFT
jgi:hypothetical protein